VVDSTPHFKKEPKIKVIKEALSLTKVRLMAKRNEQLINK